jgi:hypothetical protein
VAIQALRITSQQNTSLLKSGFRNLLCNIVGVPSPVLRYIIKKQNKAVLTRTALEAPQIPLTELNDYFMIGDPSGQMAEFSRLIDELAKTVFVSTRKNYLGETGEMYYQAMLDHQKSVENRATWRQAIKTYEQKANRFLQSTDVSPIENHIPHVPLPPTECDLDPTYPDDTPVDIRQTVHQLREMKRAYPACHAEEIPVTRKIISNYTDANDFPLSILPTASEIPAESGLLSVGNFRESEHPSTANMSHLDMEDAAYNHSIRPTGTPRPRVRFHPCAPSGRPKKARKKPKKARSPEPINDPSIGYPFPDGSQAAMSAQMLQSIPTTHTCNSVFAAINQPLSQFQTSGPTNPMFFNHIPSGPTNMLNTFSNPPILKGQATGFVPRPVPPETPAPNLSGSAFSPTASLHTLRPMEIQSNNPLGFLFHPQQTALDLSNIPGPSYFNPSSPTPSFTMVQEWLQASAPNSPATNQLLSHINNRSVSPSPSVTIDHMPVDVTSTSDEQAEPQTSEAIPVNIE